MRRRTRQAGLGLLVALALLVGPVATTVAARHRSSRRPTVARITRADHVQALGSGAVSPSRTRDRRGSHHSSSPAAVLFAAHVGATTAVWFRLDATSDAVHGTLTFSSRPRAPPAAV